MNIYDLTVNQLKRAVAIRERIDALNKQLSSILGVSNRSGAASIRNRRMSASAKRKIAAAQRARWAKLRQAKSTRSSKPAKKATNASANARRSATLKAYWAAKKRAAKK